MKKNKKRYIIIIILLSCLMVTSVYIGIHHFYSYNTEEWFKETSEDGNFVIVGKIIENTFMARDSRVYISVFNAEKRLLWFETKLESKGERLSEENYEIEYTDEYIKLSLIDFEGKVSGVYRFYLDDFFGKNVVLE